jgi:hypothetical protein
MGEGPHESRLRQRVDELGLSGRVTFQGWGPPVSVAAFLRTIDALVLLTRTTDAVREQFGRVIVEAQACGVPVIGSQSGAIPAVVGDGGWIVPERDPANLGRLLNDLAADRTQLRAKSITARLNVESRLPTMWLPMRLRRPATQRRHPTGLAKARCPPAVYYACNGTADDAAPRLHASICLIISMYSRPIRSQL